DGRPGVALAPGVAREGAVGFRCSPHPAAQALAREAARRGALPITATSLNRSGEPDCRTRAEALRCIAAQGEAGVALLAGEDAFGAAPSSVVAVLAAAPRILREGAIPAAQIARALAAPVAPAPLPPARPAQTAAGGIEGARL
ncbi:MAG: Sua5/YciO/YrdC/YwlC family protein, partial [Deltaproteobacteria bacterium]|nr:Sua5/YciO/YrdC/YwlC family protein [Deltaproteobacteria bacterium]